MPSRCVAKLHLTHGCAVHVCSTRRCRPIPPFKEGLHCVVEAVCHVHSRLAHRVDRTQPLHNTADEVFPCALLGGPEAHRSIPWTLYKVLRGHLVEKRWPP